MAKPLNEMKLQQLSLRNFKGLREFVLQPGGNNIAIYGDNATGKTTLADSWFWLLFGKDSQNKTDFEIKTLDSESIPLHGLEHEVEGVLDVGGTTLTLRKVYSENWTKKRGQANREFTGHSTDYYLDDVPVKKNEYEAKISSIVEEDAFKLLTNPRHFNEVLHWQERRKILLEVCGDVSDEAVIGSNSALTELPNILDGRKLEDHRKIIQSKRTEINQELERVPVRISEVERGLPELVGDKASATASLSGLKVDRNKKNEVLSNLEAGGGVAEATKELREVESEILSVEKNHWLETANQTQTAKIELRGLQDEANSLETTIRNLQQLIDDNREFIVSSENILEQLRKDWRQENDIEFNFEQSDTCPACGQSIPAEQVNDTRNKAMDVFNLGKAQKLEHINTKGKMTKGNVSSKEHENTAFEAQILEAKGKLSGVNSKIAEVNTVLESLEKQEKDYANNPDYIQLQVRKEAIDKSIIELKDGHAEEAENIRRAISSIDQDISDCERGLAQIEQRASGLKRIEELKEQERLLAAEYEKLEQELFLTEQFVRTKVKLLEEQINSRFERARFKLFDEQVNGAITECCETTYQGIPYSSALNNSSRINIGLDIINALSSHFSFVAPIWIDNAEAVTQLLPTEGQQITLYVSEDDKALRLEKKEDY